MKNIQFTLTLHAFENPEIFHEVDCDGETHIEHRGITLGALTIEITTVREVSDEVYLSE